MSKGTLYILLIVVALLCIYMVSLPSPLENFVISDLKKKLILIDPRFKDLDIRESASEAYSVDKSIIYICLKDQHNVPYSDAVILYVVLHEIAHVLNRQNYGHTPEFHKIFDKLLCLAAKKGVYDPNAPHPEYYGNVSLKNITFPKCPRNLSLDDEEHFTVVAEPSGRREF